MRLNTEFGNLEELLNQFEYQEVELIREIAVGTKRWKITEKWSRSKRRLTFLV
jgi:hypothetical protein